MLPGLYFIWEKTGQALKAFAALNGKGLKGRALKVNEAQARTDRPRTGGFGRGRRTRPALLSADGDM
jgi:hypothetical protein